MDQKTYWDQAAAEKEFTTPFQQKAFCKFVHPNDYILDIGCGYGRTLNELQQLGYTNLHGMDFSSAMIRRGRTQFPSLDLRVMDKGIIPLCDSSVDAVILFAVLTCIRSDDDQKTLMAEIRRILKPGGIVYVNDFLINTDVRNQKRYEQFEPVYHNYGVFALPEGAVCRHHKEKWIKELLHSFSEKEYAHLTFTTMNGHTSNGFYYIGQK